MRSHGRVCAAAGAGATANMGVNANASTAAQVGGYVGGCFGRKGLVTRAQW